MSDMLILLVIVVVIVACSIITALLIAYAHEYNPAVPNNLVVIAQSAIKRWIHGVIGLFALYLLSIPYPAIQPEFFSPNPDEIISALIETYGVFVLFALCFSHIIESKVVQAWILRYISSHMRDKLKSFYLF